MAWCWRFAATPGIRISARLTLRILGVTGVKARVVAVIALRRTKACINWRVTIQVVGTFEALQG